MSYDVCSIMFINEQKQWQENKAVSQVGLRLFPQKALPQMFHWIPIASLIESTINVDFVTTGCCTGK